MYNGIGLNTARGSGTNGYVQTNQAHVKDWKVKKADGFLSQLDIEAPEIKAPNKEILDHEKKRKIEAQVYEFRLELEEKNTPEDKIEEMVSNERKILFKKLEREEDDLKNRRPMSEEKRKRQERDTYFSSQHRQGHMIKEAQLLKNDRVKDALGIKKDYKVGEAFNFKNKKENDEILMIEERTKKFSQEKIKELKMAEEELKFLEEAKKEQVHKKEVMEDMDILIQAKNDLHKLKQVEKKDESGDDVQRKRRRYDSSSDSD